MLNSSEISYGYIYGYIHVTAIQQTFEARDRQCNKWLLIHIWSVLASWTLWSRGVIDILLETFRRALGEAQRNIIFLKIKSHIYKSQQLNSSPIGLHQFNQFVCVLKANNSNLRRFAVWKCDGSNCEKVSLCICSAKLRHFGALEPIFTSQEPRKEKEKTVLFLWHKFKLYLLNVLARPRWE